MLNPNFDLVDRSRFLHSCRSVAFKKKVWKELGGFAEWLPRGIREDRHLFLKPIKPAIDLRHLLVHRATGPRRNFAEIFKQYFTYSSGDVVSPQAEPCA